MQLLNVCTVQLASERCEKSFVEAEGNKEKELKLMLDWASGGFLPSGPEGFSPTGTSRVHEHFLIYE